MSLYQGLKLSAQTAWQRLSDTNSNFLFIAFFGLLALATSLLTLYISSSRELELKGAAGVFEGRDFSHTPFDLMDAYDACELEAQSKFGSSLLRSHMLPLSTRFDEKKGEYLVVLSADVGTADDWNEATIYCSIDPVKQEISYYKEVHDGQQSLLSKTMSMLSSMLK